MSSRLHAALLLLLASCSDATRHPSSHPCPDDMVWVRGHDVCIDRFEASLDEAGNVVSVAGAMPIEDSNRRLAEEHCRSAGKELCLEDVWLAACTAFGERTYPYGETLLTDACNTASHEVREAVPTGSLPGCEGGLAGLFDMTGNLAEWVRSHDPECLALGGSYTNQEADGCHARMMTGECQRRVLADTGFRCCRWLD